MLTAGMLARIRGIVASDPVNEAALYEWANEYLSLEADYWEQESMRGLEEEDSMIKKLEPLVGAYFPDRYLPELPITVEGALYGIAFALDEDIDYRVLLAIAMLKDDGRVVALSEHKGCLDIYTRFPLGIKSLTVGCDVWGVNEYVPFNKRWVDPQEAERLGEVVRQEVARIADDARNKPAKKKRAASSWENDPATEKQLCYLRLLGFTRPDRMTKGEAGALINKLKKEM